MLERADFADHLADLKEAAGVELGMSALHRLDMVRVGAPGFERVLRSETEHGKLLAVLGLERLDGQKAGQAADDVVHAFTQPIMFFLRGTVSQLQIANDNHFADHASSPCLMELLPFVLIFVLWCALLRCDVASMKICTRN